MIYIYRHPEKEEYVEVFQTMNEDHVYEEDGVKWKRVFTVPGMAMDTKIDPFSKKEFADKTRNKKGTYGDIMDRSAEMSQQRADKEGEDPIKRKYFDKYAKDRKGVKHQMDRPTRIETKHAWVDL